MAVHKRKRAAILSCILAAAFLFCIQPAAAPQAEAVGPPSGIMRIGLYYGGSALASANLQNVTGYGSGYEFGYYNSSREFVSIGAYTNETKITMMRDVNMHYIALTNTYEAGLGDTQIGCYHIQFNNPYAGFQEAVNDSSWIDDAYIKYANGMFYICAGDYISYTDAAEAISNRGFSGIASVTEGTSRTIAVAATGTGRVIFEFDGGGSVNLAVRPIASGSSAAKTWFKGYQYYGCFQYSRPGGEDLTVTNFINIDDYVKGVLPYEMSPGWPLEALKAQALCARTYAATKLGTHSSSGFDLCTEEHCQRYLGTNSANETTDRAADDTAGMYITYNGELCETYYASSDGGATDNVENVWNDAIPYLIGVTDPYEADVADQIKNYYWTVSYTPAELTARLNARGHNISTVASVSVSKYSSTGNVNSVLITDVNGKRITISKGENIRLTLGLNSIRFGVGGAGVSASESIYFKELSGVSSVTRGSTVYAVGADAYTQVLSSSSMYALGGSGTAEIVGIAVSSGGSADGKVDGKFTFNGTGLGHNVGMSQYGAYSMAKIHGKTAEEIVKFYFTGVEITRADFY